MELKNPGKLEFTAEIISAGGGGAYIFFPFDIQEMFGTRGRVKVKATFDGVPYRGSLANMGTGSLETGTHILGITKAIRDQIGKQPGDTVIISIELDEEPRILELPEGLKNALQQNTAAREFFEKLSYSHQRQYVLWIQEAKQEDTQLRRINKAIEMLAENKKLK